MRKGNLTVGDVNNFAVIVLNKRKSYYKNRSQVYNE